MPYQGRPEFLLHFLKIKVAADPFQGASAKSPKKKLPKQGGKFPHRAHHCWLRALCHLVICPRCELIKGMSCKSVFWKPSRNEIWRNQHGTTQNQVPRWNLLIEGAGHCIAGFPKKLYIKVLKSYGRFLGHRWHTHYNAPQACTVSQSFSVMQKTIRFALVDVFIPGKSLGLKSYGLLSWKQASDGSAAWHSNGHRSFLIDKQKNIYINQV